MNKQHEVILHLNKDQQQILLTVLSVKIVKEKDILEDTKEAIKRLEATPVSEEDQPYLKVQVADKEKLMNSITNSEDLFRQVASIFSNVAI